MSAGDDPRRLPPGALGVSVVLPVYNEAKVLPALLASVRGALQASGCRPEILFINDGSRDGSAEELDRLAAAHPEVRVLHLSRNFGHQAAVQAGLAHAGGDAVVVMDSDMQDDPGAILHFLEKWREGYDIVYAVRFARKEGAFKRLLFLGFYRVLRSISETPMPADAGNFGLVDGRVARAIAALPDRDRYFAGLRSWVGYRQVGVQVERGARYDDNPRVSLRGLWRLAKSAIFSFSALPLSIFYAISLLSATTFTGLVVFSLYHKFITGLAIPGWTSLTLTASFGGALNALGIAILGEYVVRIYDQVRARPLFLVARKVNFPAAGPDRDADGAAAAGVAGTVPAAPRSAAS